MFEDDVYEICDELAHLLIEKNKKYGDSATNPLRVFSRASPLEQIRVRIDDKLSRLQRGSSDDEDTAMDLAGYLILYLVARAAEARAAKDVVPEEMGV